MNFFFIEIRTVPYRPFHHEFSSLFDFCWNKQMISNSMRWLRILKWLECLIVISFLFLFSRAYPPSTSLFNTSWQRARTVIWKLSPFNDPQSLQLFEQNFMLAFPKEKLTTLLKPQGSSWSVSWSSSLQDLIIRDLVKILSLEDVNFLVAFNWS